jgi:hypothetical protein
MNCQSACVKEGLRLGYGPIGRLPRVVPEPGAFFQGYEIPAGVRHASELEQDGLLMW